MSNATAVAERDLSATGNERIVMGGNMSPFDAAKQTIDDLFEEAKAWLDGSGITSEKEAEAVDKLLDLTRAAKRDADESRRVENKPFDDGKAAVQARYNPILKRADLIVDTCKNTLQPWREKVAAEKAARAEKARAEALAQQEKAQAAIRASAGNIAERAKAEEELRLANDMSGYALREADRAATGNGLRRSYRAMPRDYSAAAEHYWNSRRAEFQSFLDQLAAEDVRRGIRSIPGFDVLEEKTAI